MAKGLRPGRCYHWDSPAYTRFSNNPAGSFITGIPGSKIIHFDMGSKKGDFIHEMSIIAKSNIQVRHNSLEAARVSANKSLTDSLGVANFRFKIRVYPHHVMRENAGATGAGADRVSDGMRGAYGKPIGRAARVHSKQKIMSVYYNGGEEPEGKVKRALKLAQTKLPGDLSIILEKGKAK